MSTSPLSAPLDLRSLVRTGVVLERNLDPTLFPRLCEAVTPSGEAVSVELRFLEGHRRRPVIAGRAVFQTNMVCQQCLETVIVDVGAEFRLQVVRDAEALEALPEDEDGVIGDDGAFDVLAAVEDELLLALPMVARHEQDCMTPDNPAAETKPIETATHRPFADLAGQWSKQDNQSGNRNE